jgi:hypothetical protein
MTIKATIFLATPIIYFGFHASEKPILQSKITGREKQSHNDQCSKMINIDRIYGVYEDTANGERFRILVDRLWLRGI